MAYQTGTATDHTDLLAKIIAFAVSGGGWTDIGMPAAQTTGTWLRGPGLAGTDNIYVGLQLYADAPTDTYAIEMRGAQGFIAGNAFWNQPGVSTAVYSSSWNTSMPYWIIANGQRVIAVWKVSTTYHALHFGKIFTYATPAEYGYPLLIGGESTTVRRWSHQNPDFRHFTDPGGESAVLLCFPDGSWNAFVNYTNSSGSETPQGAGGFGDRRIWPFGSSFQTDDFVRSLRENIDGSYTLVPLILSSVSPSRAVWGEIDGAFYISGANNAVENTITIAGQNYLVIQNIFRNSRNHYWALRLA